MGGYEGLRQLTIEASAQDCFDALTDYERLSDWQSTVSDCVVLDRDEAGRGRDVEYEIDIKLRKVRYRLRHDYDEPSRIGSTYLGGDFRHFEGHYELTECSGGCLVAVRVAIDPGMRLPRRLANSLNDAVLGRALADLRKHVLGAMTWR